MALSFTFFNEPSEPDGWRRMKIDDAGAREFMGARLMREMLHISPWAERHGDLLAIHDDFGHRYVYLVGDYDYASDSYELTLLERSRSAPEQ